MNNLYLILFSLILFFFFVAFLSLHFRKKRIIRKMNSLSAEEKIERIQRIVEPIGYIYEPFQDIFATRLNAPQKLFGYTTFYDLSAAFFHMVFDYETFYFDYNKRTWLVEMWKGQYGINTGCELGVYYADSLVDKSQYASTLFHAVEDKDMLNISLKLNKHIPKENASTRVGYLKYRHWWLTIFKMGTFSKPKDLFVNTSIRFKNYPMLYSFLDSFEAAMPKTTYHLNGLTVYFTFCESSRNYSVFQKIVRRISLTLCHLYCVLFRYVTKPFQNSGDKILYLYYYLPFTFRLIFRPFQKQ